MTSYFNLDSYYARLKTKSLGRPCVYLDQVESTIDVASDKEACTLVVAKQQTNGRGQRTNTWVSPPGCAMGSVRLECMKSSFMAKRLCFLQHIVALASAWTLERIDTDKLGKKSIGLKWPNDIVFKSPGSAKLLKIGGVLVQTLERNDRFDVTLSFGLNVLNKEPTTCVGDILGSRDGLSIDMIVADIMYYLEKYSLELNEDKFNEVKRDYTDRCIQIGTTVHDDVHGEVKVDGIDDDGFLIGQERTTNKACTITKHTTLHY